jgi:rRNA maturation endonuclease Nob1
MNTKCKHYVCHSCIKKLKNDNCPICRGQLTRGLVFKQRDENYEESEEDAAF